MVRVGMFVQACELSPATISNEECLGSATYLRSNKQPQQGKQLQYELGSL